MNKLPQGWTLTRVGEVLDLKYGKSLPEVTRIPGSYPVYGSNGVVGYHSEALVKGPCIIIGRKGSIGEIHLSEKDCWPIDTTYFINDFKFFDVSFLRYLLKYLPLKALNRATAIPGLSREDVYALQIAVPPILEQKKISFKLNSITSKLELALQHLSYLPKLIEKYKQSVLEAAFRGDLTNSWRKVYGYKKADSIELREVVKNFSYGSSSKSSSTGKVPVLRMGNIQDGKLNWDKLVYTSNDEEIKKFTLEEGDVLFNRTNSPELVGKTAVFAGDRKAIYAGYLIRVKCADSLLPDYLSYCLNSPSGRAYCQKVKVDGINQSNINAKKLGLFQLPLPSIPEQREISRLIKLAFHWVDYLYNEINISKNLLNQFNEIVLSKAIQGELVNQNPNDESVASLIKRMSLELGNIPQAKFSQKIKSNKKENVHMARKIIDVLLEAQDWLTAQEAFKLCGIGQSATTEEIEPVYLELQSLDKLGMIAVESVRDDSGKKLYDRIKLNKQIDHAS